jgi:hypothetical protein
MIPHFSVVDIYMSIILRVFHLNGSSSLSAVASRTSGLYLAGGGNSNTCSPIKLQPLNPGWRMQTRNVAHEDRQMKRKRICICISISISICISLPSTSNLSPASSYRPSLYISSSPIVNIPSTIDIPYPTFITQLSQS